MIQSEQCGRPESADPSAIELFHARQLPQHCIRIVVRLRDWAPVQRQLLQQRQALQHLPLAQSRHQ